MYRKRVSTKGKEMGLRRKSYIDLNYKVIFLTFLCVLKTKSQVWVHNLIIYDHGTVNVLNVFFPMSLHKYICMYGPLHIWLKHRRL